MRERRTPKWGFSSYVTTESTRYCTQMQSAVGRVLVGVGVGQGEQHRERVEGVFLGRPRNEFGQHAPERRRLQSQDLPQSEAGQILQNGRAKCRRSAFSIQSCNDILFIKISAQ